MAPLAIVCATPPLDPRLLLDPLLEMPPQLCRSGLFIFSESGKPVRYCSDGDFRSLLNSVAQGSSGTPRPGSAEVWDNSM